MLIWPILDPTKTKTKHPGDLSRSLAHRIGPIYWPKVFFGRRGVPAGKLRKIGAKGRGRQKLGKWAIGP